MMIPVSNTPEDQEGGGVLAVVGREAFLRILKKMEQPLVLHMHGGFPKMHKYLVRYQGYLFALKSKEPHDFTREAEVIHVQKVHLGMPGVSF